MRQRKLAREARATQLARDLVAPVRGWFLDKLAACESVGAFLVSSGSLWFRLVRSGSLWFRLLEACPTDLASSRAEPSRADAKPQPQPNATVDHLERLRLLAARSQLQRNKRNNKLDNSG